MRTNLRSPRFLRPLLFPLALTLALPLLAAPRWDDVDPAQLRQLIASYNGKKTVLVNVWATWCLPCVKEFPDIVRLQKQHAADLQVLFVSVDSADARQAVETFLEKQGVDWTTYRKVGKDQEFIDGLSSSWSGAIPATLIVDKEGKEVTFIEGITDFATLEKHIQTTINKSSQPIDHEGVEK